uniref:Uncharacterized protein n=1 Tax=Rhizophora mucronata TaxID=61149 RepID=A0A2P2PFM9_RHIMU
MLLGVYKIENGKPASTREGHRSGKK